MSKLAIGLGVVVLGYATGILQSFLLFVAFSATTLATVPTVF